MAFKRSLVEADYQNAASTLGVEVAVIKAIATQESKGSGFADITSDGKKAVVPVILYERHIMYRRLSLKYGKAHADAVMRIHPDLVNSKAGGYGGASAQHQHDKLTKAAMIDRGCALESCSWGEFQIMGFHWAALGYKSLQEFINKMYSGADGHLDAFIRYAKINNVVPHMKSKNWVEIARRYNGANYKINRYDEKLKAAYDNLTKQ